MTTPDANQRLLESQQDAAYSLGILHELFETSASISEEQEDVLCNLLWNSESYPLQMHMSFKLWAALLTVSSRRQQFLGIATELLPQMISDWHERKTNEKVEIIPQAAAVCQCFKVIVTHAQLKKTTLKKLIESLRSVCHVLLLDYFDDDSTQCGSEPIRWSESYDRGATGSVLVAIFTVLTNFERRRLKASMPPTAMTCTLALRTILFAIPCLMVFPDHRHALSQRLTEYAHCLFAVSSAAQRVLTSQKLTEMQNAWVDCCSDVIVMHVDVDGALLEATMAESLALAARPIVDVYSYIVESIVWPLATTSSDQLMAVQSLNLRLWSCIRAYEDDIGDQMHTRPLGADQVHKTKETARLLQLCDTKLIRTIAFVMAKGTAQCMHSMEAIVTTLVLWAEAPAPLGDTAEALRIAGDMVCCALHSVIQSPDLGYCFRSCLLLVSAAHCAGKLLFMISEEPRGFVNLVRDLVEVLDKILSRTFSKTGIFDLFDNNDLVETLWKLLVEVEEDDNPAVTEAYALSLCRLLAHLRDIVPCLVARVLLLGEENKGAVQYWPLVDASLKRALGSSYGNSTAKREVARFGRRLAGLKKSCKCWKNWGSESKPCSFTKPVGGVRLDDSHPLPTVARSGDSKRADAAMASLSREKAASEANAAKRDRKRAFKALASRSRTAATSSICATSASPGPTYLDVVGNVTPPATPARSTAAGDAGVADVSTDAAKPFGHPQSAQTASAQRKEAAQHSAVRSGSATPAASDPAGNSRLADIAGADAAMASLLLEEAALESAASNKAAKMARKRARKKALKAAASDSKVPASPATSVTSATFEEPMSQPRPGNSGTAPAAANDDSPAACRPGQFESRQTKPADWMLCPITKELLCDPVVCTDGFSYERSAAVTWLKNNDTSFVTGDRLCSKDVVPNLALRSRLRAFKSI